MKSVAARRLSSYLPQLLLTVVLLLLFLGMMFASEYFLTLKNLKNIAEAASFRLILAIGMTVVIASGGIDLSVGSIVSVCGILMAGMVRAEWAVGLAIFLGVLAGTFMGALNGAVIAKSRISPFIITLAFMSIYRGLGLILTKGIPITKLPSAFLFFGRSDVDRLNPPLWLAFGLLMLLAPLLFRTKWGQYVMALGGNEEALRRQGVATDRYRMYAHMMAGFTAAVTGLIITARLNSAEANAGLGMEVDAITAVILGGTSLSGGRASLFGTSVAVILLGSIRNALTILSISSYYQQFVMGLLLLLSVLLAKWREQT